MTLKRIIYFCIISILFESCAIQVPPDGGKKDLEPPHLLSSEPANYSNLFKGHDLQLNFDEFISLNEIGSQLIVSPLLKYPPVLKIRKKSLLIHFQDTLLENTTYTMNFGQGIADNNEGNKLENFQFVFSTGTIIDSLDVQGSIETAFSHKKSKDVLALLYRSTKDSIPFLEKPLYFSRTNDSGQFRISNISPGYYKLIGLKEADGNYLYSPGEELIGFPDTLINANSENVNLEIFNEVNKLRLLKAYSEFPGKAVVVFNAPADTVKIKLLTDPAKLNIYAYSFSKENDTINIWYKNNFADSLSFHFDNYSLNDTITIRLFKLTEENKGRKRAGMTILPGSTQTILQHLHLPHYLQITRPIDTSSFDKIVFYEDSLLIKAQYEFTDSLNMQLNVNHKWKGKSKYSIFIPSGTFTDIYGIKNDTIQFTFDAHGEADYGSIKIIFKKSDTIPYLLQLVDDSGSLIFHQVSILQDTIFQLNFLDPRVYKIKLIRDENGNGKWDTGNYIKHVQPEQIEFYPDGITVRANWDVDVNLKVPILKK